MPRNRQFTKKQREELDRDRATSISAGVLENVATATGGDIVLILAHRQELANAAMWYRVARRREKRTPPSRMVDMLNATVRDLTTLERHMSEDVAFRDHLYKAYPVSGTDIEGTISYLLCAAMTAREEANRAIGHSGRSEDIALKEWAWKVLPILEIIIGRSAGYSSVSNTDSEGSEIGGPFIRGLLALAASIDLAISAGTCRPLIDDYKKQKKST